MLAERVTRNVVRDAPLPREDRDTDDNRAPGRKKAFTQAEVSAILRHLQTKGHWLFLPVALAAGTGLRRAEVLALRWGDVDTDAGVVKVRRSVTIAGVRCWPAAPKSKAGIRDIPISGSLVDLLKRHCKAARENGLVLGMSFDDSWLLWPRDPREPTDPWHPRTVGVLLGKQLTSKKLGIRGKNWHAIRHYHASMLVDREGVDQIKVISRRLGHAKVAITQDLYVTPTDEAERAAGDVAGAMLDEALAGCSSVADLHSDAESATDSSANRLNVSKK